MQSKKFSHYESATNIVAGLILSFITQLIIYPLLDIEVTFGENVLITFVFLVISYIRSYVIRRIFNNLKEGVNK